MAKKKIAVRRGHILQSLCIVLLLALLVGILFAEISRTAAAVVRLSADEATYIPTDRLCGYVFRDEEILLTTNNGPIEYLAQDGSFLPAGSAAAHVYIDDRGANARDRARELYAQIEFLEQALEGGALAWQKTYLASYAATMAALSAGEMKSAASAADSLSLSLRRAEMGGADDPDRAAVQAQIDALRAEIAELIRYVADQPQTLHNELSGSFYRYTDGFETLFARDAVATLTPEGLRERLAAGQSAENAVGKVVDNGVFYLALPVGAAQATRYVQGEHYPVRFLAGGGELSMQLERISLSADQTEALLILKGDRAPAGMTPDRRQTVCIAQQARTGLAIPRAALYEQSGEHYVFVAADGVAQKRRVEIVYESNGVLFVVQTDEQGYLRRGEQILLAARRIYEGKAVRS